MLTATNILEAAHGIEHVYDHARFYGQGVVVLGDTERDPDMAGYRLFAHCRHCERRWKASIRDLMDPHLEWSELHADR